MKITFAFCELSIHTYSQKVDRNAQSVVGAKGVVGRGEAVPPASNTTTNTHEHVPTMLAAFV